jgi:cobalt-precorrin 5A hydrolase
MGGGEAVIVAGIGCTSGCDPAEVVALVRRAVARTGAAPAALASAEAKAASATLRTAAAILALPLLPIGNAALAAAAPRCATRSPASLATTGLPSLAEAAALAAAGPASRLLLPRIAGRGATCALAGSPRGAA